MASVSMQIKIDEKLMKQAIELFSNLGIDISEAISLFLEEYILHNGLPFAVEIPCYKREVLDAMEEAKAMSRDPSVKRYQSFSNALEDIEDLT